MDLIWILIGGFVAFLAFRVFRVYREIKRRRLLLDMPVEVLENIQARAFLETQSALGDDYSDVLRDYGDFLVKFEVIDKGPESEYPLNWYPVSLLPHDKSRIAEILDYLIINYSAIHLSINTSEYTLKLSRMTLDYFTDYEEVLREQQDMVEALKLVKENSKE